MSWSFDELVAQASRGTWVKAGDVLGSVTLGNGGCLGELWGRSGERKPEPLQPGDVVELEVSGIGVLRNRIGQPEPRVWTPQPRPDQAGDAAPQEEEGRAS